MNNLTWKHLFAAVLLSSLLVGCSKKSSSTSGGAETGESTIVNGGTNQDGNNSDANNSIVADDADDAEDQVIIGKDGLIKREIITNCRGEITVKTREYDASGNLVKITEYKNVADKNNLPNEPYAVRTYRYDENGNITDRTTVVEDGTPIVEQLSKPSQVDNRDADGTGTIVDYDVFGTKRTFNYENYVLISGKAEYKDGTIRNHAYTLDEDNRIIKVAVTDESGEIIETRDFVYDNEGNRIDEKSNIVDDCPITTEYEYF